MLEKDTQEVLLKELRPWVIVVSRKFFRAVNNQLGTSMDDLRQEMWVGMWKAAGNWDGRGTVEGWMKQNAIWVAYNFVKAKGIKEFTVTTDDGEESLFLNVEYVDDLEEVYSAYHAGEIQRALEVLTPKQREYVIRRFWWGQRNEELKEIMNSQNPVSSYWAAKKYGARDRLAKELAHLKEEN